MRGLRLRGVPARSHIAGFALGVEDLLGVLIQIATPVGLKLRIRDGMLRGTVAL